MTALFGPVDAVDRARALRDAGADGVFTFEGPHDVFTPLTLATTVGGLDLMVCAPAHGFEELRRVVDEVGFTPVSGE